MPDKRQFSPAQSRAARGLLNCGISFIERASGVDASRLRAFECQVSGLTRDELARLTGAYKSLGVMPKAANKAGEGVRLKRLPTGSGLAGTSSTKRTPCAIVDGDA